MLADARPVLTLTRGDVAGCVAGLDAGVVLVVDDPGVVAVAEQMPGDVPAAGWPVVDPAHPAYVIYTSGGRRPISKTLLLCHLRHSRVNPELELGW